VILISDWPAISEIVAEAMLALDDGKRPALIFPICR
jgi:hypothetical protein